MRYLFIILLLLTGCGSGGSQDNAIQPIIPPDPIESAQIADFTAQYIEHTVAKAYFIASGSFYNDGDVDLNNAYYQISGEDYYWEWSILKVAMVNIPRQTNLSFTTDIENTLNEVIMITGRNLPADYRLKVELKTADGTVLDVKHVTVVVI